MSHDCRRLGKSKVQAVTATYRTVKEDVQTVTLNRPKRLVCMSVFVFFEPTNFYCPPRDHNKELIDSLWATGWGEGEFLQEVNTNQTLSEPLRSGATPAETWWATAAVCTCERLCVWAGETQAESKHKIGSKQDKGRVRVDIYTLHTVSFRLNVTVGLKTQKMSYYTKFAQTYNRQNALNKLKQVISSRHRDSCISKTGHGPEFFWK